MKELQANLKYVIVGIALVACAIVAANAYTYKFRAKNTVVVTGLAETEFTSDLIVWNSNITTESTSIAEGYAKLEQDKKKVAAFIKSKGIPDSAVVFQFVNVEKLYETIYNKDGYSAGQRFSGSYQLSQGLTIESKNVPLVENVSREISALIADGVSIDASRPSYYYTQLDNVKLGLIERAASDARSRAQAIAKNAGASLGGVVSVRMGVFQITGSNTNEDYEAGGSFNTADLNKKARITMRVEYKLK